MLFLQGANLGFEQKSKSVGTGLFNVPREFSNETTWILFDNSFRSNLFK